MISISERAAERVHSMLGEPEYALTPVVRVVVESGGCSGLSYRMSFVAAPELGDEQFCDKGLVLACDKRSFFYLIGTELDFSDGLQGKGFHFHNPNAARTCACGESFSL
jgi:iron-sulfur cluster assembly protein